MILRQLILAPIAAPYTVRYRFVSDTVLVFRAPRGRLAFAMGGGFRMPICSSAMPCADVAI
eukprot:scaffold32358_cov31-Tisochrysis_lutea.AAC.3